MCLISHITDENYIQPTIYMKNNPSHIPRTMMAAANFPIFQHSLKYTFFLLQNYAMSIKYCFSLCYSPGRFTLITPEGAIYTVSATVDGYELLADSQRITLTMLSGTVVKVSPAPPEQ